MASWVNKSVTSLSLSPQRAVDVKLLVRTDQVEPASIPVVIKINYINLVDYKDTGSLSASSRCLNYTVNFTMSRLWQVCLLLEGSYGEVTIVFQLLEVAIKLGSQPLYIPNHSSFWLCCFCALFPDTVAFEGRTPACPRHLLCCGSPPGISGSWPLGTSYLSAPRARLESDQESMCFSPNLAPNSCLEKHREIEMC